MARGTDAKAVVRIARFLSHGPATVSRAAQGRKLLLDGGERGSISAEENDIAGMASDGLVRRQGPKVWLSDAGGAFLRRQALRDGYQVQHREIETARIELPVGSQTVEINLAESPLAQLARRKDKDGSPYLDERQFRAGERLRSDYTRGQLMPRLGANWIASVASGRRDGNGTADITDAALASRQRVEAAVDAVGPELSGVLIDICCFLKGLEQVEMERRWPARSAKLLLKTALSALARHYEPDRTGAGGRRRQMVHWGSEDYRPTIGG